MKKIGLVLVAGGSGLRMGSELAKQFIPIANKPILQHTIDRFLSWNKDISLVVVLPETQIEYWYSITASKDELPYKVCSGGSTRFESVKNGLKELADLDYVMIHDGVRPFVSEATIERCIAALESYAAVVPVIAVNESVRMIEGALSKALDRDLIRLVQTPQCFHFDELTEAYNTAFNSSFTDDASVFEHAGNSIHLVEGNQENIKITRPEDLQLANLILQAKS
jgi:2-C-methyl-D-erythritol 4-phosphate cytidylyltransferase